ncbi:MAG: hypothetical protein AMXMBFR83_22520 [Phycisphaerae bacterium]
MTGRQEKGDEIGRRQPADGPDEMDTGRGTALLPTTHAPALATVMPLNFREFEDVSRWPREAEPFPLVLIVLLNQDKFEDASAFNPRPSMIDGSKERRYL